MFPLIITPAIKCRSFYPQNFPSAALSSVGVATATPPSSALHMKNSAGYNPATFNRRSNKDSTKIVHVDELLKFLSAMTGDRAYEQVIEMKEDGKKVDSMCEMAQRMISRGREEGRMEGRKREIFESIQEGDYDVKRGAQKLNVSGSEFEKMMEE